MTAAGGDEPLLRVVRGRPTDTELAALVTVLVSRRSPADPTTRIADGPGTSTRPGDWVAYWRHVSSRRPTSSA